MDFKLPLPDNTSFELNVVFTDDNDMQALNYEYRGKDRPTDVLSFSSLEGDSWVTPPGASSPLGEIVISVDTAIEQAREYDTHLYQELLRLLIHGVLHIAGYEHEGVPENVAHEMRSLEDLLYEQHLSAARELTTPELSAS